MSTPSSPRRPHALAVLAALAFLVSLGPLPAQKDRGKKEDPAQVKVTLRKLIRTAKKDPELLLGAAEYARSSGLERDAMALFRQVIAVDPNHAAARRAMGHVQYQGDWMLPVEVEKRRTAALQKLHGRSGLVLVEGVFVEKERVQDAKQGVFWYEDERVTREEKLRTLFGATRHPKTGLWVEPADAEKAEDGFPLANGAWGNQEEADAYHTSQRHPWVVRSANAWIVGPLPMRTIEEAAVLIDGGVDRAAEALAGPLVPEHRPVVLLVNNAESYRKWGDELGDFAASYGAFSATDSIPVDGLPGPTTPAIAHWVENWGVYYARHAGALAYVHSLGRQLDVEFPRWFSLGFGGFVDRHDTPGLAGFFGIQQDGRGGVPPFKRWLDDFEKKGMASPDGAVYLTGLLIHYALRGDHPESREALAAVGRACQAGDGKAAIAAVKALEEVLRAQEEGIRAFHDGLVTAAQEVAARKAALESESPQEDPESAGGQEAGGR